MATQETPVKSASQICEEFNDYWPIGSLVEYWKGGRDGSPDGIETTRSNAWPLCGEPSILLNGVLGPIPLTHINVIVGH